MLYAVNQALETNLWLGRVFGKLEGERWDRLRRKAGAIVHDSDPNLSELEYILERLTEPE